MQRQFAVCTVTLFAAAAVAFAFSAYALGAWLAFGTVATAALALSLHWFEDRPATVEAIAQLDASLAAALRESNERINDMATAMSSFQSYMNATALSQRPGNSVPGRSPVRPPTGVR